MTAPQQAEAPPAMNGTEDHNGGGERRSTFTASTSRLALLQGPGSTLLASNGENGVAPGQARAPVLLRFEGIHKSIDVEKLTTHGPLGLIKRRRLEPKLVLQGISGCARPGELVALMGPSGSGKTTLLNLLCGRSTVMTQGTITLNGTPLNRSMKRLIAYVMQQDIFFEHLTVREQLTFTAMLRVAETEDKLAKPFEPIEPAKKLTQIVALTKDAQVKQLKLVASERRDGACLGGGTQVQRIIDSLGLGNCANTKLSMVSGGEKKRANIGTELLTDPSLLILDEPTSGLDSTAAVSLIASLKMLAHEGLTVLTSIHQPSSPVFQAFDKLFFLADGHTVYVGPPKNAVDYFERLGYAMPDQYNAADFLMDVVHEPAARAALIEAYQRHGKLTLDLPPMDEAPKGALSITYDTVGKAALHYADQISIKCQEKGFNAS